MTPEPPHRASPTAGEAGAGTEPESAPPASVSHAAAARRARPLDEDLLDDIASRIERLPEPLAAVATGIEVARDDGDLTGIRKRLFELGIAVVRYSVSVALALLSERLGTSSAPKPLADALARAARLSDGAWCALARNAAGQLDALAERRVAELGFLARKPLADLVQSRNHFVHGTGFGDDAPNLVLALLSDAEPLLDWPLCWVASLEPPSFEERRGAPLRPGVWRKKRSPLPAGLVEGRAYLVQETSGEPRWTPVTPWLPSTGRKLLLLDAPHAPGGSWRSVDVEAGEHRDAPELDAAIRSLCGAERDLPVVPTERPSLVGRQTAIAVMRRAAEIVQGGGSSVVLLTGPQGVGRGRMLEVVREASASFGLGLVVESSCLEHRRGALRPLRRAVEPVAALSATREAIERAAAGDALAGAEGLTAAIEAVEETLVEVSVASPLLLTVDDVQWADGPTLRLLSLLTDRATRRAPGRILVVVACRDEPTARAELTSLVGQVERDVGAGATRVTLDPLEDREARSLVRGVAPLARALEDRLVAGAAGLPFLLVQSVLAWSETGALRWDEGAWAPAHDRVLSEAVPGVAEVVSARLASTFDVGSEAEQCARQALAVVGAAAAPLPIATIERVLGALGRPVDTIDRALEALVEAGLFVASGARHEVRYAQPMVREAVVESLRRKPWFPRLLRALLEVLGEQDVRGEDSSFIAQGYLELGDVAAAVPWLVRSIEHSMTLGLFTDAVAQADRLARVARDATERAEAHLAAADALLRGGDAKGARSRLALAAPCANDVLRLRAQMLEVSTRHALGEFSSDGVESLLAEVDAQRDVALQIECRIALAPVVGGARGLALVEQAASVSESLDRGDLRYRLHALKGALLYELEGPGSQSCRRSLELAREAAREVGSRWAQLDADNDLALQLSVAGEHDRAIEILEHVAEQAGRERFGTVSRGALVNIATFHWRAGRHRNAAESAGRAVEACRRAGDSRYLAMALSIQADALLQQAELDGARGAIDEAIAIKTRAGDKNVAIALLRRAEIAAAMGQSAQAREDARHALASAQRFEQDDFMARAQLWLALYEFETGIDDRRDQLARIVSQLEDAITSLRPPTRALLERARLALDGTATT